jgi:hypothetical protein
MNRVRSIVATGSFALVAAASLLVGAPGASAADVSTITIHHRLCPTDAAITDYFAQCHDNKVGTVLGFTLTSDTDDQTVETDLATSNVVIETDPGVVEISGGVPGEFAKTFVYCSQDGEGIEVSTTDIGVSFDAPAGEVVCDWYNTPEDLSGGGGDDDDDDNGGVTQLPNTGAGSISSDSTELYVGLLIGLGTIGAASVLAGRRQA